MRLILSKCGGNNTKCQLIYNQKSELLTIKHKTTMTDLTMILLALGMVAVFMGPFFIISAIKDRKEAKQKQEENEEK